MQLATPRLCNEAIREAQSFDYKIRETSAVDQAINRLTIPGGKRFRAYMTLLSARVFDLEPLHARLLAESAEQVHAAFLLHDDVLDEGRLRRGRPTFNAVEGNRSAILAGDRLLARVMTQVASLGSADLIQDLALAIEKTVDGELAQNQNRWNTDVDFESLREIAEKKTGALFSWALSAPARLKGADAKAIECLQSMGQQLGVLFQFADDALDFRLQGDKEYAKDLKEGLLNSASYCLIQSSDELRAHWQELFQRKTCQIFWCEWDWKKAAKVHDSLNEEHRERYQQLVQQLIALLPAKEQHLRPIAELADLALKRDK